MRRLQRLVLLANKLMHANCYAAFNKNGVCLRRRVSVGSDFAGPQSRDFKRWAVRRKLLFWLRRGSLGALVNGWFGVRRGRFGEHSLSTNKNVVRGLYSAKLPTHPANLL